MKYDEYLNQTVDQIYQRATDIGWTWNELAQMAGVHPSTVYKLGMRITRLPQLRTMFLLARAVNMNLPTIKKMLAEVTRG